METLTIPDLAYWFEGCVNFDHRRAAARADHWQARFYNCPKLSTLTMYYGETVLNSIGEDAFWREADSGDTLYIAYIIGYPEATVPFYDYDWAASNRSNRYFYDLYGVYQNADAATLQAASRKRLRKFPTVRPPALSAPAQAANSIPFAGHLRFHDAYIQRSSGVL